MIINGTDYLLCEKRGCEFFKGDTIRDVYDYTKKNPRLIYDCGLAADLQSDVYRYHPSADAKEYEYTQKDVLRFVNDFSGNRFQDIKWIQSFDATIDKGANFTPATLIRDFAKKNRLETECSSGETIVKMYTGNYKYLCYNITAANETTDRVTVIMEQA